MKKTVVFDAWAIISFLKDEPGAAKAGRALDDVARGKLRGAINAVNLTEIYYITRRSGGESYAEEVMGSLSEWGLEAVTADYRLALLAGELKADTALSLADAFAAATALSLKATFLTGDTDFHALEDRLEIEWL